MASKIQTKTVAIVGAGGIGLPISKAILEAGLSVKILSRSRTPKQGIEEAQTVAVDYNDVNSIREAFEGVDVVISTANAPDSLQFHKRLADAAKVQGVKLFVPSDFGMDIDAIPPAELPPQLQVKQEIAAYLEQIGLPYLRIHTGVFAEYLFSPFVGFDVERSAFRLVGSSEVPVASTAKADVGGFVAHILSTQPLSEVQNQEVKIQSFQHTLRDYLAEFEKAKNVKLDVQTTTIAEAQASIPTLTDPMAKFSTLIRIFFAKGYAKTQTDNERFRWNPKYATPIDFLKATAAI